MDGINGHTVWNPKDYNLFVDAIVKMKNLTVWNQMSTNSKILAKAAKEKSETITLNTLYNKLF